MSKLDDAARAMAEELNGGKFDDEKWYNDDQREVHKRRVCAVLTSIRDPKDIPPSQLAAWQANIDSILKDSK